MYVLSFGLMFVGWLLTASSTIVWVGKGIYDLVRTDQEFLTILVSCLIGWGLQTVVGLIFAGIGYAWIKISNH